MNQRRPGIRILTSLVVAVLSVGAVPLASAQAGEPSADDVRAAGDEFNQGRTAFKATEYSQAAEHFEKADSLAPNPKVLLLAIQSRQEAGQLSRAATLAALAQERYPADESFADSRNLLTRALAELGKLKVTCDEPCSLVVDSRIVHGGAMTKRFIFLDPGQYKVRASFATSEAESQDFQALAGQSGRLAFSSRGGSGAAPSTEDWGSEPEPGNASSDLPSPKVTYDDLSSNKGNIKDSPVAEEGGVPPVVFWVSSGLTAALLGVTIWSGVDTQNNPGPDAVRTECAGLGASCSLYQQGKDKELRTNVLWGATAGVGLATILIGALWTDWGSEEASAAFSTGARASNTAPARHRTQQSASIEPWLSVGDGAAVGARGRF